MADKREAEFGIVSDAVQAILRHNGYLADRVGAQIGKLIGLQTPKDLFGRIELWRIGW